MADPVLSPDGRVQLRDAAGSAFSVAPEEAEQALAGGEFRLETPEEFSARQTAKSRSTLGQQAITAGEGALRGATFGLGTAALAELGGEEYAQAAKERAEANPKLAVGAEIAGALAPTLLSGGTGAVGAAARLSPAALAGKIGIGAERLAARGLGTLGGEGVLATASRQAIKSGLGAGVETGLYGLGSSLADSSLDGVDWTAERALAGLEEGLIFGAPTGAAFGAAGTIAKRAAKRAASEVVDAMAQGQVTFRKAIENWAEERAAGTIAGKGAKDADDLLRKITDSGDDPARLDRIRKKFAESGMETGSRAEVATVAKSEAAIAVARHAELARELMASGARPNSAAISGALGEAAKSITDKAAAKRVQALTSARPATLVDAERLHAKIEAATDWARKTKSTALPELEQLSSRISKAIDDAADGVPELQGAWAQARQDARDWRTLAQRVGKAELTDAEVGKIIGLAGSVAGIATGSVLPLVGAAIAGQNPAVRQFARQRGGEALGWLASRAGWVERSVRSSAKRIAGHAPSEAIAAAVGSGGGKAKRGILESVQTYPTRTREETAASYTALSQQILSEQQDPVKLATRLSKAVAPIATSQPEVASAMISRLIADQQYLASKLPPPLDPISSMVTKSGPPTTSRVDQERILRYADALRDPAGTVERLASGKIDWEGADALRERRPLIWDSFRTQTLMAIAAAPEPIAYKRRAYLSVLFGVALDPSLQPAAATTMPVSPISSPTPGSSPGSPSGLNPEKVGQEMATPAQVSAA